VSNKPLVAGPVLAVRARDQLDALLAAERAVRAGDEEGVHDARVAARRLSAAFATFRSLVDPEVSEPLREELRWLARSLGAVRDQEVVRERLTALLHNHADQDPDAAVLVDQLRSEGQVAGSQESGAVLDDQRCAELLTALDGFVTDPPWTSSAGEDARAFLRRRLRGEWDRLVREVTVVVDAPPGRPHDDQLHDARKAAKRMRYALESAELVWPRKPQALRKHIHRLTDILGEQQDTVITRAALVRLAGQVDLDGAETSLHGRLHEIEHRRAAELEASFRSAWVDVAEVARRWP
jgi:CHAD domain-containing protein